MAGAPMPQGMTNGEAADDAARATGLDMLAKTRDAAADSHVRVPIAQFRAIAAMLIDLADRVDTGCGADCMGRPIDGVRFWAPADLLAAERRRAERAEAENRLIRGDWTIGFTD